MTNTEMTRIYDRYSGAVYRTAFTMCKNTADAEDITQETFIQRFRTDISFEDDRSEKSWLIRVAVNKCKDMFRSVRYKYFYYTVSLDEVNLIYETKDESEVYHAVMELPPKYRIVIHLYYYEGYSTAEIGKIIGRSETAVQTQLYRARKKLKDKLGEEMYL